MLVVLAAAPALAQTVADRPYGGEDKDWRIAPQAELRRDKYHAPTPTSIPGGRLITTFQLNQALQGPDKPLLVNLLTGKSARGIAGSLWLSGGGQGIGFDDLAQDRLAQHLDRLSKGNKAATIVFYCLSAECWLSYNATLRALRLGYANALWYRGGVDSWAAAGLPVALLTDDRW
ncbi:MAG: sulfurtransferase [Alphaproteobacteria bacterium]|nr:sulfurtransferase [Alphaproteobacteria bacterium]